MIDAAIIRTMAAKEKLDPGIIEKDYVLSKALMALSQVDGFRGALIFKGGTALKKCYYHQWRFSEDLDFTSRTPLSPSEVKNIFEKACEVAAKQSGLSLRVVEYSQYPKTGTKLTTAQLKLGYDGPLRKSSGQKNNVRVDIAFDEKVVSEPISREIFQQFTDDIQATIPVYPLEEIVAEKLRSILQRGKSRDYYDVWILLKNFGKDFDRSRTGDIFAQKCRFKDIPDPKTEDFFKTEQLAEAERFWERGLAHQLTDLLGFQAVIAELRPLINKLIH